MGAEIRCYHNDLFYSWTIILSPCNYSVAQTVCSCHVWHDAVFLWTSESSILYLKPNYLESLIMKRKIAVLTEQSITLASQTWSQLLWFRTKGGTLPVSIRRFCSMFLNSKDGSCPAKRSQIYIQEGARTLPLILVRVKATFTLLHCSTEVQSHLRLTLKYSSNLNIATHMSTCIYFLPHWALPRVFEVAQKKN